jgi:hypothetical protein
MGPLDTGGVPDNGGVVVEEEEEGGKEDREKIGLMRWSRVQWRTWS